MWRGSGGMRGFIALVLLAALGSGCATATPESAGVAPWISNMRFEGLKIREDVYVSAAEFGRDYKILLDFESSVPVRRVWLQTKWQDGRVGPVLERSFEVVPPGVMKGILVIPSRILKSHTARDTDWWVEDSNGRVSNKLVQRVIIRD